MVWVVGWVHFVKMWSSDPNMLGQWGISASIKPFSFVFIAASCCFDDVLIFLGVSIMPPFPPEPS